MTETLPAIFRRLKESGEIDIYFPTVLSHTKNNVHYMQVYGRDGHSASTHNIMLQISDPVEPEEYADVKARYERAHDVKLRPYKRWQQRFSDELHRQWIKSYVGLPMWIDEVIPKNKQDEFMELVRTNDEPDYYGALTNASYYGYLREWIGQQWDTEEYIFHCDKPFGRDDFINIIYHDHLQDFTIDEAAIALPEEIFWKIVAQTDSYDDEDEELYEDFQHLPKWRYCEDKQCYRPTAELFKAGEKWYSREHWEENFQRRLL